VTCAFIQLLQDGERRRCRQAARVTVQGPDRVHLVCERHSKLCVRDAPLKILGWGIMIPAPLPKRRAARRPARKPLPAGTPTPVDEGSLRGARPPLR
jgi:hypothetical protein